jgi:molybdenum cofactor cytidylyltransferase
MQTSLPPIGILLAAGYGRRFDPLGRTSKLLQTLPGGGGLTVAGVSAAGLRRITCTALAVVRPGYPALAAELSAAGCQVIESADAERGMGAALAAGVRASPHAGGWLVALADMPWIAPSSYRAVLAALDAPKTIAVPVCDGRRGHPVAFGAAHGAALAALDGDEGARMLLRAHPVRQVQVEDPGVLLDIDLPQDLR